MISRIDKNSRTNVKAILGTRDGVCFQKWLEYWMYVVLLITA
jgi:hypothetical protein